MKLSVASCVLSLLAAACGGDDGGPCDPVARKGCDNGLVCEAVPGGDPKKDVNHLDVSKVEMVSDKCKMGTKKAPKEPKAKS